VTMYEGYDPYVPPRRRHRLRALIIVLIVLAGLLVAADFAARSYAENQVATHIEQQGFPTKPKVTIDGFPFLTQVASRDFHEIQISSGSVTEGPLQIQSINATLNQVLVDSSFSSGTISQATGNADITFAALSSAMTSQSSGLQSVVSGVLTLSAAGPNEVKAAVGVAGIGVTAVWRITLAGPKAINIQLVPGGSLPSQLLGGNSTIILTLPGLPMGLHLASINVTPSGVVASVTGQNVSFGG
jgi:LmeA-like phospholipid-binding